MQTGRRRDLSGTLPAALARVFLIAIVLWVGASVVLAIPHGPGHSIESMRPFEVLRDAAFPVWVGAFACVLVGLALRAIRSFDE